MSENNRWQESTFEQITKDLNSAVVTLQVHVPPPDRLFTPEGEVIEVPKEEQERIVKARKAALARLKEDDSKAFSF